MHFWSSETKLDKTVMFCKSTFNYEIRPSLAWPYPFLGSNSKTIATIKFYVSKTLTDMCHLKLLQHFHLVVLFDLYLAY